jgi:UDP-N-acetylglucosamine--N-acetylmuramyl-(pentapeptide) pyrophosphoryl-undecaprenol N-acetylglucosamine transferase
VYPLLVVVEALRNERNDVALCYVGHADGLEAAIVGRSDLPFRTVDSGPIRGTTPAALVRSLVRLWRGYRQARRLLREWRTEAVLTTGGYVSVPVAIAAWRERIPLLVYLPDLEPGLAVRLQSRFADRVAVSFDRVRRYFPARKVWVSGYPVRAAILEANRAEAISALGLEPGCKTLLGFGGSRGARAVNRALVGILPDLLPTIQVVHITGDLDWPWVSERHAGLDAALQKRYHPFPYLHGAQLAAAFAASDLVVARAGAATMAEFPAVGLPAILVPYPYSGQHQQANADFVVSHGAAVCVADAELSQTLKPTIQRLLSDEHALAEMSKCARALARPHAARHLAQALIEMARGGRDTP